MSEWQDRPIVTEWDTYVSTSDGRVFYLDDIIDDEMYCYPIKDPLTKGYLIFPRHQVRTATSDEIARSEIDSYWRG